MAQGFDTQYGLKVLFLAASPLLLQGCADKPIKFDPYSPAEEGKRFESYLNNHPSSCYKIKASIKEEGEDEEKKIEKDEQFEFDETCETAKQMTALVKAAVQVNDAFMLNSFANYYRLASADLKKQVDDRLKKEGIDPAILKKPDEAFRCTESNQTQKNGEFVTTFECQ